MLCYLHSGALIARQVSQAKPTDPVEDAVASGKLARDSGHLPEAVSALNHAIEIARQRNDAAGEAKCLIVLGSVQKLQFHYRAALDSLQQSTRLADKLTDKRIYRRLVGAALGNSADIFAVLGDFPEAESQSVRAIALLKQIDKPEQKDIVLLTRAFLAHAEMCFKLERNSEGYKDSDNALSRTPSISDIPVRSTLKAMIWNVRGKALMEEGRIAEANDSLQKSLATAGELHNLNLIVFAKELLAELELKKPSPDFKLALHLIDQAFAAKSPVFDSSPQYYPIDIRGRILMESGNKSAALSEFLRAVTAAGRWRTAALPGDATNTQTVAALQQVYADYAHLAAEVAIDNNDNSLAIKALEVLAENRAASLREQLRLAYSSSFQMPDEYYSTLSQLQAAQAQVTLGRNAGEDKAQLERIRLEVSNLDNQIGIKPEKMRGRAERISRQNSLRDIQRILSRDQVLISITLGKRRSYLWTVTGQKVSLTRLAGEEELTSKADLFAAGIKNGRASASIAADLSRSLFSGLPPDVWNRSEWMIVADGPLLRGIPFCALNNLRSNKRLIDTTNIRFLPSELLLLDRKSSPSRDSVSTRFIGVGDPIYNRADARLVPARYADAKTVSSSITLARLPGSDREVRSASKEAHSTDPVFLTGSKATRDDLKAALAHPPGVLHFAVHVVSPPDQPQQAALALSLKNGIPELLTPEAVASFHTPGSLVVLSGCSSGQGRVIPGAGLVGLSRAWLLAGASAVVVSSWPTPDDSGRFFSSFYGHFNQDHSGDIAQRAALALRQTQLDMLNGSGYQTSPSFWGAFSVISKE